MDTAMANLSDAWRWNPRKNNHVGVYYVIKLTYTCCYLCGKCINSSTPYELLNEKMLIGLNYHTGFTGEVFFLAYSSSGKHNVAILYILLHQIHTKGGGYGITRGDPLAVASMLTGNSFAMITCIWYNYLLGEHPLWWFKMRIWPSDWYT